MSFTKWSTRTKLGVMALEGWALVAVLYSDTVVPRTDMESTPITDPGCSYSNRADVKSKTVHHVIRQARFLVRLDQNSALAQKSEELEQAKHSAAAAKIRVRQGEEKCAALEKEKVKAETELERARKDFQFTVSDLETQRTAKRKLEIDIGKIREAIGAKQMKEILGTP